MGLKEIEKLLASPECSTFREIVRDAQVELRQRMPRHSELEGPGGKEALISHLLLQAAVDGVLESMKGKHPLAKMSVLKSLAGMAEELCKIACIPLLEELVEGLAQGREWERENGT